VRFQPLNHEFGGSSLDLEDVAVGPARGLVKQIGQILAQLVLLEEVGNDESCGTALAASFA